MSVYVGRVVSAGSRGSGAADEIPGGDLRALAREWASTTAPDFAAVVPEDGAEETGRELVAEQPAACVAQYGPGPHQATAGGGASKVDRTLTAP